MTLLPQSSSIDFMEIMKFYQKWRQKSLWNTPNRQVWKETRTDIESATFETLETAVDLAVLILFDARKSTKRDFSTTMLVTPPGSPFRVASTPTLEESASHHPRPSNITLKHIQWLLNVMWMFLNDFLLFWSSHDLPPGPEMAINHQFFSISGTIV